MENLLMKIYLFNFKKHGMKKTYVTAAVAFATLAGAVMT